MRGPLARRVACVGRHLAGALHLHGRDHCCLLGSYRVRVPTATMRHLNFFNALLAAGGSQLLRATFLGLATIAGEVNIFVLPAAASLYRRPRLAAGLFRVLRDGLEEFL